MGIFLIMVGLGWAILGFLNFIVGFYNINQRGGSEVWGVVSLIFNMVLFVIPGLIVAGIGKMINKKTRKIPHHDLKKCPKCAEEVRAEAQVCRFCGFEFPTQIINDSVQVVSLNPEERLTSKKRWF